MTPHNEFLKVIEDLIKRQKAIIMGYEAK